MVHVVLAGNKRQSWDSPPILCVWHCFASLEIIAYSYMVIMICFNTQSLSHEILNCERKIAKPFNKQEQITSILFEMYSL